MTTHTLPIAAALLAAVSLSSAPVFAGQQNRDRENRQDQGPSSGRAVPRDERVPAQTQPQRQAEPQRQAPPQRQAEPQRQAPPQRQAEPQRQAPPQRQAEPQRQAPPQRQVDQPRDAQRGGRTNPGGDGRRETAVPRSESPRYAPRYEPRYEPRSDSRRYESRGYRNDRPIIVAPRYDRYGYGNGYGYAPRYYRPYVFRPRFSIGFGIFAGYPVPYSYSYPYPIPVYGYSAPRNEVMVGPGSNQYGGVSLEISPSDARVYVDGNYAGEVRDFDGTEQPLTLTYGTHRIDVQAPGYETLTVDVAVQPGQVIPYRGDLQPIR